MAKRSCTVTTMVAALALAAAACGGSNASSSEGSATKPPRTTPTTTAAAAVPAWRTPVAQYTGGDDPQEITTQLFGNYDCALNTNSTHCLELFLYETSGSSWDESIKLMQQVHDYQAQNPNFHYVNRVTLLDYCATITQAGCTATGDHSEFTPGGNDLTRTITVSVTPLIYNDNSATPSRQDPTYKQRLTLKPIVRNTPEQGPGLHPVTVWVIDGIQNL